MVRSTALLLFVLLSSAAARPADWSGSNSWYSQQTLTPATQGRLKLEWNACCDNGDVYHTRFRSVTNDGTLWGEEHYQYLYEGQWLDIPSDVVQHKETPNHAPVLFLYPYHGANLPYGTPTCFIIPETGT